MLRLISTEIGLSGKSFMIISISFPIRDRIVGRLKVMKIFKNYLFTCQKSLIMNVSCFMHNKY